MKSDDNDAGCLLIIILFILFMMGFGGEDKQHAERLRELEKQVIKLQAENEVNNKHSD